MTKLKKQPAPKGLRFVQSFKHWRNGKIYFAKDYGHKAWPIG